MKTNQIINATGFYNQNASSVRLLPSVFFGVLALDRRVFTYRIDPSTGGGFDLSIRMVNKDSVKDVAAVVDQELVSRLYGDAFWLVHAVGVETALVLITLDGLLPLVSWTPSQA